MCFILKALHLFVQTKIAVTMDDFVCGHSVRKANVRKGEEFDWQFNYVFAKEVTEEDFKNIERSSLDSKDHGQEVSYLCT